MFNGDTDVAMCVSGSGVSKCDGTDFDEASDVSDGAATESERGAEWECLLLVWCDFMSSKLV